MSTGLWLLTMAAVGVACFGLGIARGHRWGYRAGLRETLVRQHHSLSGALGDVEDE